MGSPEIGQDVGTTIPLIYESQEAYVGWPVTENRCIFIFTPKPTWNYSQGQIGSPEWGQYIGTTKFLSPSVGQTRQNADWFISSKAYFKMDAMLLEVQNLLETIQVGP